MIVGAMGHLATTAMVGVSAMKHGLCGQTGMVTAMDPFSRLDLEDPGDLIFGGWDIRKMDLHAAIGRILGDIGPFDATQIPIIQNDLDAIARNIFPGSAFNSGSAIQELAADRSMLNGRSLVDLIAGLASDIERFKADNDLENLVVVNLASTEPPIDGPAADMSLAGLERAIQTDDRTAVRASTLYAYAAIDAGAVYINFTPSQCAMFSGLVDLAQKKRVPLMGSDGKTGETLVKTALAPMFACRNLNVLSWQGYNILGNMDGAVLAHAENKESKIRSKDKALARILGYRPHSQVSIDYVPSLGDRKTAWDFIHFEGFLNTRMTLQFTWQGCDSALAAPLVLDLIRLGLFAKQQGESGLMQHLACFFKSPVGVEEHDLHRQFQRLQDYAEQKIKQGSRDGLLEALN
ncbi:inositol-3-phosphate synthase [Desulfosarcina ovata]|uniref:Myo-inositol-1-phosphate synthase n=1 Tax=Desulfosarcina ovata subsp. ovata TaxID=2752305 RepID=A0A5K8A516_9BACT|nr:inositol-3-phosphate synthase [Desulfosarcina ovata]BBO87575.1 myo-inositol-1-phosphate synthase [Desulfosarcina ovata subsp. ovata]